MARHPSPMVHALKAQSDRMERYPKAGVLRQIVESMHRQAEALDAANRNQSPLDTDAAHIKKIGVQARKYDQAAIEAFNRAAQAYSDSWREIEERINAKVNMKPDAFANEIRQRFVSMPRAEQSAWLKKLCDGNQGPVLAALLKAPEFLTGIPADRREAYERDIYAKHAAEELAERDALTEAMDLVSAAFSTAGRFTKEIVDPAKLASIDRADAQAREAAAGFDQAVA